MAVQSGESSADSSPPGGFREVRPSDAGRPAVCAHHTGNAWDYYLPALASLSKISSREEDWIRQIGRGITWGNRIESGPRPPPHSTRPRSMHSEGRPLRYRSLAGRPRASRERLCPGNGYGRSDRLPRDDEVGVRPAREAIEIWGRCSNSAWTSAAGRTAGSDGMWFRFGDNTIEQVLDVILPFVESYEFTPVEAGLLRSWLKS